jgi:hypothetical protein
VEKRGLFYHAGIWMSTFPLLLKNISSADFADYADFNSSTFRY